MSDSTKIEWTDASWNPVTGCTKVSQGCKNCYAEHLAPWLQAMHNPRYVNGFAVTLHHDLLNLPSHWRRPKRIFVNSMSDLMHELVPDEFIAEVFAEIMRNPRHTFQILTKRPERALALAAELPWPHNLLMGTSVENAEPECLERIDILRQIPAHLRFLSMEPLLSAVPDINLHGIHWLIAGGESGPKARPNHPNWFRDLQQQCQRANIPFFFKQWGGTNKKLAGRLLDGRTWNEEPTISPPPTTPT